MIDIDRVVVDDQLCSTQVLPTEVGPVQSRQVDVSESPNNRCGSGKPRKPKENRVIDFWYRPSVLRNPFSYKGFDGLEKFPITKVPLYSF